MQPFFCILFFVMNKIKFLYFKKFANMPKSPENVPGQK